jgi:hypothetical protein
MDKSNPPETFGVFKPMGHTVMALRTPADAEAAIAALAEQGLSNVVTYSPQEMAALADAEREAASPLAAFGYELELLNTHLELAESGCSFVVVRGSETEQLVQVAEIAHAHSAASAQHYGLLMIQDLIDHTAPNAPTPDLPSPAR